MTLAIDCLAVTGVDVSPWVPIAAAALIAAGLGLTALGRRGLQSARGATMSTLAIFAIAAGLASAMAPVTPAHAAADPCKHLRPVASTVSPPPGPTATTPSPASTPEQPLRRGSISGLVTKNGWALVITSPPGAYATFPGMGWDLPTFQGVTGPITTSTVTLTGAGVDGVFGTADDTSTSTSVATDGTYSFTGVADGDYRVSVTLLDPAGAEPDQSWESPYSGGGVTTYNFGTTAWSWQTPAGGIAEITIVGGNDVTGQDFLAVNDQSKTASTVVF